MGEALFRFRGHSEYERMKRRLFIAFVIAAGLLGGFMQEFIKVNVNYQIEQGDLIPGFFTATPEVRKEALSERRLLAPLDYYYSHKPLEALNELDRNQLVQLKWGLTLAFVLFFLWCNTTLIALITRDKGFVIILLWSYLVFFALALAVYALGRVLGMMDVFYPVSRRIAGALQSLIPVMVILPAWWIIQGQKKNEL